MIVVGRWKFIAVAIPPVNRQAKIEQTTAVANLSPLKDFAIEMNTTLYVIFSFCVCV